MADFEMTPSELELTAAVFTEKADDMRSIVTELSQQVDALSSGWDGAAQDAFFETYESMKEPMDQFSQILDGIAEALKALAEITVETDDALAQQMSM